MTHEYQFLMHRLQVFAYIDAGDMLLAPLGEVLSLLFAATKEEDACLRIFVDELLKLVYSADDVIAKMNQEELPDD